MNEITDRPRPSGLADWHMLAAPFHFLDPGPLVDGDLELVSPSEAHIGELLACQHHPLTLAESPRLVRTNRAHLMEYLARCPGGRVAPGDCNERSAAQHFWIRLRPGREFGAIPAVSIAGAVGLRIGSGPEIESVLGHLGYNVYPPARGHHLAERSCRLLLPLARRYGLSDLWITCNPDNVPSRRTCERLGARLVDIVPVPRDHPLFARGEHHKCRFVIEL